MFLVASFNIFSINSGVDYIKFNIQVNAKHATSVVAAAAAAGLHIQVNASIDMNGRLAEAGVTEWRLASLPPNSW